MEELYPHIIDCAHGIVMTVLVYLILRILFIRKEGIARLRYWTAAALGLFLLEPILYNIQEWTVLDVLFDRTSDVIELLKIAICVDFLYVFYRNRYIYRPSVTIISCGSLLAIAVFYFASEIWHLGEWSYCLYLVLSTIAWTVFCLTIEHTKETEEHIPETHPRHDQWESFRNQLEATMLHDQWFCNENLTREDVCRALGINRNKFSQQLQEAYDKSFSEFLRDMRLDEAARLLRETDMPIDQVAFSVGIKSPSGFHRNFLLSFGLTPAQYRQKHQTK